VLAANQTVSITNAATLIQVAANNVMPKTTVPIARSCLPGRKTERNYRKKKKLHPHNI
jgi:hypothetical protein